MKLFRAGSFFVVTLTLASAIAARAVVTAAPQTISTNRMQAIYEAVKTPYKYGTVLEAPSGKSVESPGVFHHGDKWYLMYTLREDDTTELAESVDLLHWQPLGTILARGEAGRWDVAGAAGSAALVDVGWGGTNELQMLKKHFWLTYTGGASSNPSNAPTDFGLALTPDPAKAADPWKKLPMPVLRHNDTNARPFETAALLRSQVFFDPTNTLGMPLVMFYSARQPQGDETIGVATSRNLRNWRRLGDAPVIPAPRPADPKAATSAGDPQVTRLDDLWVMFHDNATGKTNGFDTFAVSRNLTNWTTWSGEALVKPSESRDAAGVKQPWVIKHDGVVYHFYCATGGTNGQRVIALATSRDLRPPEKK